MTPAELEKRIRILEDLEEIMKLQRQYMYWFDNHEWAKVANCFAENATVQIRNDPLRKGKKEIAEQYATRGKGVTGNDAHFVGQPIISIDEDTAKGYWNVCILFAEPIRWVQGRNECEYNKENGKWKFSSLKFTRIKAAPPSLAP